MISRLTGELLRLVRLPGLLLHILIGLFVFAPWASLSAQPERVSQRWFRILLIILNLRMEVSGQVPESGTMLAGNHISWLDIAVIVSAHPVLFVSKAEVGRWPVVGPMARAGGTLFIERGAHATTALYERMSELLGAGRSIVIFPEGTTTRGGGVRRFQARLFAAAILSGTPVTPFALRYDQPCAPYVDDDVMAWHIWRLLREPVIHVELEFGEALEPGEERKALASRTQGWVEERV